MLSKIDPAACLYTDGGQDGINNLSMMAYKNGGVVSKTL